jgi:hypothetical protein
VIAGSFGVYAARTARDHDARPQCLNLRSRNLAQQL